MTFKLVETEESEPINNKKWCECGHSTTNHTSSATAPCTVDGCGCSLYIPMKIPTDKPSTNSINHPSHYNLHPSGIECITISEHFNFNVGNAIKYLWRAGLKSENPLEDLKKAAWYIQREIERVSK